MNVVLKLSRYIRWFDGRFWCTMKIMIIIIIIIIY